jgi:thermitase
MYNQYIQGEEPMIRKLFICLVGCLVVGSLFAVPLSARAQPAQTLPADGEYVPNEVLVKVSSSLSSAQRKQLSKVGAVSDSGLEFNSGKWLVVEVPGGDVPKAIDELQQLPGVIGAQPNYYVFAQDVIPNDPAWSSQYGLRHINAPAAWEISEGSTGVTIAILDSGVDFHQHDLAPKLVRGFDFVNVDDDPQDDFGHGTQVAGIAAAVSNNCKGVAGVSWGARIMPVKVLNAFGNGSFLGVAGGIRFAANSGARVINMSLGGPSHPDDPITHADILRDAVDYAAGLGVVLVAAAGNNGDHVYFPGAYPNVIAVASTGLTDQRSPFSNQGPEVDLAAPGEDIVSTGLLANGESLVTESGTSFSAPFVSGAAAMLLSIPGNNFSSDVIRQLETTARDLGTGGPDNAYGNGLLQVDAALKLAVAEHPLSHPLKKFAGEKCDRGQPTNGPTSTPELALGGFGSGGGSGARTGSAGATPTPTPTPTFTATPTLTATPTSTPTATPGGGLAAKPTSRPAAVLPMPPMPVVAGFFLLVGMGLIGYALALRRGGQ